MLNYLTAPHVVIWSAVACSSAFPGLFPAQELLARDSNGKFVKYAASTYYLLHRTLMVAMRGCMLYTWHDAYSVL